MMEPRDLDRFMSKVAVNDDTGCWDWTGSRGAGKTSPYAMMQMRSPRGMRYAHRLSYAHFKGPIPSGATIDHTCRNTICVNPDHLDAVTHRENVQRHYDRHGCKQGHPWTEANTMRGADGRRRCRICYDAWYAKRKAR